MRGARAKKLRKLALGNPRFHADGWVGRTFIRGRVQRAYRDLKKAWAKGKREGLS